MNLVFVSLAAVAVIFHPVLTQQTLPITVLQGDGDTCPSDQEREGARENITTTVRTMIQISQGFVPSCGEGVWKKVISLDMSDPSQQCPSPWREYTSIRSCGRPDGSSGCHSVTFGVNAFQYNKVCGRAIGYQYATPDAFGRFISQPTGTADDNYVDGLSVTHGSSPRSHIWTFAAGLNEANFATHENFWRFACPCAIPSDTRFGTTPPSYVGDNYFCESGNADVNFPGGRHYSDPLWDGQGCVNSECCSFNAPPWFSVQLPTNTTDDIEVRICGDQGQHNEDTTIELLEIYVQ